MTEVTTPIAETNHFIVLDKYISQTSHSGSYQSEADLERELLEDLESQGYTFETDINTPQAMLKNVREQLQKLNHTKFTDDEWQRFVETYLDKASETITDKARKLHDNYLHDFIFDDGHIENIALLDKKNTARNHVQVIKQFEQTGAHPNRYDVTLLVNGLPLVHIELKKRGVAIREAFNQIHRYSKESFNSDNSLYKYVQIFVISNGTDTRYFANTTKRNKNNFDFTMNWSLSNNDLIKDLKDFTVTFFRKETLLNILVRYSVFDSDDNSLIMRPYQIGATERIIQKVTSSYKSKNWSCPNSGGYVWHTTGSGKTLTSFKAALLATELDFIDKVLFVVDRKDLDYQTIKEYQRFSPESVNGSNSTAGLKRNLEEDSKKIIVTTIQKLHNLIKKEDELDVYNKQVMLIFDECHRSQFGDAQKAITNKFKKYYQFGFTGTPILPDNASSNEQTTEKVFGTQLHKYIITDAIRDEKVLKFKIDYNNVRPQFKIIEQEQDEKKLNAAENKEALLHPKRIEEISHYLLDNFNHKTHRSQAGAKGFNAMLAVSSIEAAKLYYTTLHKLQENASYPLKIATIFSFTANEKQNTAGDIQDEEFNVSNLDLTAKEFLTHTVNDYNERFKTNFKLDDKEFQNYYRDLSLRVKKGEIDLLIVVGMFLTGFDAPRINTLFVDKNLRYHGLIQAFSRTNRIYDSTKTFGNIVTFRDLEPATNEALRLFGDSHTDTQSLIREKSYKDYMEGFTDPSTGKIIRGFIDIIADLEGRFPNPADTDLEEDKKDFVKLFGMYLRSENILQNYDEFTALRAFQSVNKDDNDALEAFKIKYHLDEADLARLEKIHIPSERKIQNYRSAYNDIRDWRRKEKLSNEQEKPSCDWDDVVFEVDLLKSQEINLDYILGLLYDYYKKNSNKKTLIEETQRIIRASLDNRAKESLIVDFLQQINLEKILNKPDLIEAFYKFAEAEQEKELQALISKEKLNEEPARRYIAASLKKRFASEHGTDLNEILPKMSPLNPRYLTRKQHIFLIISEFVEKYQGIKALIDSD